MSGKFGIIKKTIADLWYGLFCYIPGGVGIICRRVIWRKHLYQEGKKAIIQEAVKIKWGKRLHLGENVAINEFCWIEASGEIQIGNNVWIGPRTSLISFSHEHTFANHRSGGGASTYGKGKICEKIVIEDNVWIGASCVILKGVTIGEGSIVGAGSVVTRDVPAFSIVAGVPAKVINTVDKEAFFVNEDDK